MKKIYDLILIVGFSLSGCAGVDPVIQAKMTDNEITEKAVAGEQADNDIKQFMQKNGISEEQLRKVNYMPKDQKIELRHITYYLEKQIANKKEENKKEENEKEENEKEEYEKEAINLAKKYNSVEEYCNTLTVGLARGGEYIQSSNSCELNQYLGTYGGGDRKVVNATIQELKKKGNKSTIVKYEDEAKKYEGTLSDLCEKLASDTSSIRGAIVGKFNENSLDCEMTDMISLKKYEADYAQFKYDTMKPLLIDKHKQRIKERKQQDKVNESKRLAEQRQEEINKAEYERKAKIQLQKQYICTDGYDSWILKYNGTRITFGERNFVAGLAGYEDQFGKLRIIIDRAKGTVWSDGNNLTCKPR